MNDSVHGTTDRDLGAVTYPLPSGIIVDRDVRVAMRDGVHLAATVFRPDKPGRFPIIMSVTAYGKDFGPDRYSTLPRLKAAGAALGTFRISDITPWEGPDPGFWVPNGYVVIAADARGFFDSEGTSGIFTRQDAEDYADLIAWAAGQEWSTGAVGLNGVSYLAINQWLCASHEPPAQLKAIIPWEGMSDMGRDSAVHGGIPETRFTKAWVGGSLTLGGKDIATRAPAMMEHSMREPFPLENIRVPTLVCGSWSDQGLHSRGSVEAFMRITSTQKWLYTHGRNKWDVYYSPDALEWQKSFFDHFLKGEDNGFDTRPPVRLEVSKNTEEYTVRQEANWPIERARYQALHLDIQKRILSVATPDQEGILGYDSEVKEAVAFDFEISDSLELTGPMVLKLWVAAEQAEDLDLFVVLRKIDRDGREVHFCGKDGDRKGVVAMGWLRVSQRHKDPERSTAWRPFLSHDRVERVSPGEVVPVEIEILASSTLFESGERLRLAISGRDIVETVIFGHDDSVNSGKHLIYAGGKYDSHLLAPFVADA